MINRRVTTMAMAMLLAVGMGMGAGAASAHSAQTERMKQCNVEAKAKTLKGDERKQFMKGCLSHHDEAKAMQDTHKDMHEAPKHALNRQQEKMKTCNVDAKSKGLKGADRRKFMSTCLKG